VDSRARHPVITAPAVARSDYDPLEPQALAWDDPHRASSSPPSARRRPTSTARDLHPSRVFLTCVRARFSYLLVRLTVRRRPRELRRLLLLRGELLALAVQVQERGGVLLGEAHAVTRVHAQSTEGALLPLWMRTAQSGSLAALGYTPAVPLCFCKPGQAESVRLAIKNSTFDIRQINFEIDRYVVEGTTGNNEDQYVLFPDYGYNI